MKDIGTKIVKVGDPVAITLLARDFKGFGHQDMNGVVEIERDYSIREYLSDKDPDESKSGKGL